METLLNDKELKKAMVKAWERLGKPIPLYQAYGPEATDYYIMVKDIAETINRLVESIDYYKADIMDITSDIEDLKTELEREKNAIPGDEDPDECQMER